MDSHGSNHRKKAPRALQDDRGDRTGAIWRDAVNGVLAALQTSAFVALGRIFDDDKGTHNADGLLRFAEDTVLPSM